MLTHPEPDEGGRPFRIQQQNTNKSCDGQHDLLISLKKDDYDICAVQEPYIDRSGQTRANYQWFAVYPSTHTTAPQDTRSIILINTNLLTNNWRQIPIPHPDITAIEITSNHGTIRLLNIYNDCKNNDTLNHVSDYINANPAPRSIITPTLYIWLGDFNRHHPLWDEPRNLHLFTKIGRAHV